MNPPARIDTFCGEWRPSYLQGALVPAAFASCVASRPNAPCLVAEDGAVMTFAEVNAVATRLARRLVARGVGKDKAVAILFERQPAVVVSMIAVHKANGCYVPLDPNFPADRLSIYVEDSESLAVITEPSQTQLAMSLVAGLPLTPQIILYNDPTDAAATDTSIVLPDVYRIQDDDLAYIMFTSGSTGRPKGVMIPHRGVKDLVAFNIERFGLGSRDVFCLNSTVCFDSYVTYVFASLSIGAKLVVPGPMAHLDPYAMAGLIATNGITMMEVVPALASEYMQAFKEAGQSVACLTRILTGGEALTPNLAESICTTLPGIKKGGLFNSYGPTEATVTTITGHITAPFDRIPLGRPDHNVHTYVVLPDKTPDAGQSEITPADDDAKPTKWRLAQIGEPGELWLSGPRLARGYRNRPEQTAAAYVPNPWYEEATAALGSDPASQALKEFYKMAYRTNDLVVMGEDCQLEYLGRCDRQIKINGVRMEVSEVEAVLAGAPGVTHAAVKPWKDATGTYRLAGYVAPDTVDLAAAEAHCRSKLLPAMVPAKIVSLPVMPKLPNGKIDVKSLAEPEWAPPPGSGSSDSAGPLTAPATDMETLLADIWSEELKLQKGQVDVNANFFQLGGNSLRAGLINSKLRRATGADISGLLIYQHSTVTAMAAAIESQYGKFMATDDVPRKGSFIQTGTCFQSMSSSSHPAGLNSSSSNSSEQGDSKPSDGIIRNGSQIKSFSSRPLPVWLATIGQISGAIFLVMIVYMYGVGSMETTYYFALLNPNIFYVPLFLFAMATIGNFVLCMVSILTKWVLLGKQKPGVHALWSWYYIRWWIVRASVKLSVMWLFPYTRRTPLLVWYFRALGCKIGKNVCLDSFNIGDWDMIEIGDNTVLEADCFVDGSGFYAAEKPGDRGIMIVDYATIGKHCTLLPTSIVSHGNHVPDNYILTPGTTAKRLPSGPSDNKAHMDVRTEKGILPLWLCFLSIALLIVIEGCLWMAIVPTIMFWIWLLEVVAKLNFTTWPEVIIASRQCWIGAAGSERLGSEGPIYNTCDRIWWTFAVAVGVVPWTKFVVATVYVWMIIPLKWIIVGRMTQKRMDNGGLLLAWRRHTFKCLIIGPFQSIVWQFSSTELYNIWLRALGAKIGRQCWLSEMFRCTEFELFECEDTASMCSMVTVTPSTAGRTERVKFGEACDVTNDCTLVAGSTVGKNAVLGVFTYGAPGQNFDDYSITLGSFKLKTVQGPEDIEAGLKSGNLESAETRLLPNWQYVMYNIIYLIGSNTIFIITTAMMELPASIAGSYVLYHYGYWFGAAAAPVVFLFAFFIFVAYLAVQKRIVMAKAAGKHPIFKSLGAGRWQMMCINNHLYDDFNYFKGSLFYNWFLRAMGTKVGKEVFSMGGVVAEFDQVSIGDGTVIGEGAFLLTHTVENRHVKIRPITVGKQCTVGALSAVLPDGKMEDFSTLEEMSLVMKGETVPAGATWSGIPASPVLPNKHSLGL